MITRTAFLQQVNSIFSFMYGCVLLGPRQCGKSTLAREIAANYNGEVHFFDLEHPDDLASLAEPMRVLEQCHGLVIIDEIQRKPELFSLLRVLLDQKKNRFLLLGSASLLLIRHSSETLAGRVGFVELTPLQMQELPPDLHAPLMWRGGLPPSLLAKSDQESLLWREFYLRSFVERDIPQLGINIAPETLRRFWMMLTHYHGQILQLAPLASSLSVSHHTIRHYLDILVGTFMIRLLPPWFENLGKRQTKSPKLYIRDPGLMLALMRIGSHDALLHSPFLGRCWEGVAIEQLIQATALPDNQVFYWNTHQGTEVDLLLHTPEGRIGIECKFSDAPRRTKSMHHALADLKLAHLYIAYPGQRTYPLLDNASVIPLASLLEKASQWRIDHADT